MARNNSFGFFSVGLSVGKKNKCAVCAVGSFSSNVQF
jgi:hypothetical protein